MLREVGEDAAVVAPTGDAGTGTVQQQQRRTVAGLVVPEHTLIGVQFPLGVLVTDLSSHRPPLLVANVIRVTSLS